MKNSKIWVMVAVMLLSLPIFSQGYRPHDLRGMNPRYETPRWAPPHYQSARYYYLPDIETYYDLALQQFIFLRNGVWVYSSRLPFMYDEFSLEDCFAIVLNVNVFKPWLHHHYYVSHYPRFYYIDYYDHNNIPYVRGFDENYRHAIYWGEQDRYRARRWDDRNMRDHRDFRYSKDDRRQQKMVQREENDEHSRFDNRYNQREQDQRDMKAAPGNRVMEDRQQNERSTRPERKEEGNRQQPAMDQQTDRSHGTNYYGKQIGNPVRVERQMRDRESRQTGRK